MQVFKLTEEIIEHIRELIASDQKQQLKDYLESLHFADIAEITSELELEEAAYLVSILNREKASPMRKLPETCRSWTPMMLLTSSLIYPKSGKRKFSLT